MKFIIPIFWLLSVIVSCSTSTNKNLLNAKTFHHEISVQEKAVVLDVRTKEEFDECHLPNALHADWNGDQFDLVTSEISKDTHIYVYCHSGTRSASAAEELREKGYQHVRELDGGIVSWTNNGYQVITGVAASD